MNLPQLSFPFHYKQLAYFATALTGFASLCAQVAWQKYLTILVGSETRSISLVVAIFLLGLAVGYHVFGKLTEKKQWSRWRLLKVYGYVELATAIYISVFYIYFYFLKNISFNSPSHFLVDIALSCLALFLPTFLMGASLPALTATLPDKPEDINAVHVRIYGWNTFGAFLGVLISGFYLLPAFGLALTLTLAGAVNLLSALIFMGNRLEGSAHKATPPPQPPSSIPNGFYIAAAFLTGSVIISFEVLFVRLLNLSVGAGVYNFPIILSLFVGGLAVGSLSVKPHKISAGFFINQILITAGLLGVLFLSAPYWSIWISHARVSLLSIPSNYFVFKVFLYLFTAVFLFPAVFFMGRLLPLTYALLKKTEKNYGAVCGSLYFFNTLGTVFGTLIVGYLAFYIFDLDDLFKINGVLLTALAVGAGLYEKRAVPVVLSFLLGLCFLFLPDWNRTGHHIGYFRQRAPQSHHFKKVFFLPKSAKRSQTLFFEDGPDVSVSLLGYKNKNITPQAKKLFPAGEYSSISFVVNGKAIGNSLGDFSTMFLVSGLAYLYGPNPSDGLSSAVIGLGTGISAGVLGKLADSREVTVLEIAPEVVDNVKRAPSFSFDLVSNPKVKIIEQDGFKYFTKTRKKFDLIVSEPSNPWIVGVENVFSLEFYETAKESLSEGGVFIQWAQLYSIDAVTLKIIFQTLKKVFPHAKVYRIGGGDIAIVAGLKPLKWKFPEKRFYDPVLIPYYKALGLHSPEDLKLTQVFSEGPFSQIAESNISGIHTLTFPKLAYRGDKTFFIGRSMEPEDLASGYVFESPETENQKIQALNKLLKLSPEKIRERCVREVGIFCNIFVQYRTHRNNFEDANKSPSLRWTNYVYLRKRGLIRHRDGFLKDLKQEIIEKNMKNVPLILNYLNHLLSRGHYDKTEKDLTLFKEKELITTQTFTDFKKHIDTVKKGS